MSSLLGSTPVIGLSLENPFLGKRFPKVGHVEGTLDTGYQGFLAVPEAVFDVLALGELKTSERKVELADGTLLRSRLANATAVASGAGVEMDGPVETFAGLDEILVGTRFLSNFKLTLDYCLRVADLEACPSKA